MAKANPGDSKDYGSSEPSATGEGYAVNAASDPETRLQEKQVKLLQTKAAEKRLQEEINRLTAHTAVLKAWENQVGGSAGEELNSSRKELGNFVDSGKKALDEKTNAKIVRATEKVDSQIKQARTAYDTASRETEEQQAALIAGQRELAKAAEAYANAKALTTGVKQTNAELLAVRQKVESLVKANKYTEAGFWLYELDRQLKDTPLDKTLTDLSAAWDRLEAASEKVAHAADGLTDRAAREASAKKAFDDATKNRVKAITDLLAEASPKTAAA